MKYLSAAALVAAACAACVDADVTPCGSMVCPTTSVCVGTSAPRCVTPAEHTACNGLVAGAECHTADTVGTCIDGACSTAVCGNDIVEPGEVCDDGNRLSGDGCSYDCRSTETCGNGIVDFAIGEQCDDGNTQGNDACEANCQLPRCGDHVVNTSTGEVCDDGNNLDGDGCARDCRSNEHCGNGVRDPGEECDDGNLTDHDGCQSNCKLQRCGDGILDGSDVGSDEQCDDGNIDNTDDCLNTCRVATCGDGFVHLTGSGSGSGRFEECDDGNRENGDACTNACENARCGDGILYAAFEQCDDGNTNDTDCCSNGCHLPVCGNGVLECNERCDDGPDGGSSCRHGCTIDCGPDGTGLGIDWGQIGVIGQTTDETGATTLDFGEIFGGTGYGGATYAGPGTYTDLSSGQKHELQPDNVVDVSTVSFLTGSPGDFGYGFGLTSSGNYCETNGNASWSPTVQVNVTDACGTHRIQEFSSGQTGGDWPTCP